MNIAHYNSMAWDNTVKQYSQFMQPVSSEDIAQAKNGEYNLLLTSTKTVPKNWIGTIAGRKVLCLAAGGGQQAPIFAALGAHVTVFDNSAAQLAQDNMIAQRDNLSLTIEHGDMRDLSRFNNETFDLIFHPTANCFIDVIQPIWMECYRVLQHGGILLAGFINPLLYIFDIHEWEHNNTLIVKHSIPYSDVTHLEPEQLQHKIDAAHTLEFGHSLHDQIAGQLECGFVITGFYEDSIENILLSEYINTDIATRALKPKIN